jgi:hypothetical protein
MTPRALFLVTSDPRASGRPAEAVRIAAGVAAWKKVEVTLYLHSAAVLALGEFADDLIDGDNFRQYLPVLADSGAKFFMQDSEVLAQSEKTVPDVQAIKEAELADLAAKSQYVLRF